MMFKQYILRKYANAQYYGGYTPPEAEQTQPKPNPAAYTPGSIALGAGTGLLGGAAIGAGIDKMRYNLGYKQQRQKTMAELANYKQQMAGLNKAVPAEAQKLNQLNDLRKQSINKFMEYKRTPRFKFGNPAIAAGTVLGGIFLGRNDV